MTSSYVSQFAPSQHVTAALPANRFHPVGDADEPQEAADQWVMAPWGGGPVHVDLTEVDVHIYDGPYQSLRTIGQQFYGYESGDDDEAFDGTVTE